MLKVQNLTFSYQKDIILKEISFDVKKGEHIAITGASGSGKSTLLKLIYGEFNLKEGYIFWNDTEIKGPAHNLVVGYPFMKQVNQEFDLMPFITVEENINKHLSRFDKEDSKKRAEELIVVIEMVDFAQTKVKYLSSGQKQRVAIAKALAKAPEILLLDEPFSHIDNFKKQSLRRNIFSYLKQENITCLMATHDKNDVLGFADRMSVLHESKIFRDEFPEMLYKNPELPLIASFFEEYNLIDGQIFYTHQIKIALKSNYTAVVKRSFFNGAKWLIEAEFKNQIIYLQHSENIPTEREVFIYFLR